MRRARHFEKQQGREHVGRRHCTDTPAALSTRSADAPPQRERTSSPMPPGLSGVRSSSRGFPRAAAFESAGCRSSLPRGRNDRRRFVVSTLPRGEHDAPTEKRHRIEHARRRALRTTSRSTTAACERRSAPRTAIADRRRRRGSGRASRRVRVHLGPSSQRRAAVQDAAERALIAATFCFIDRVGASGAFLGTRWGGDGGRQHG